MIALKGAYPQNSSSAPSPERTTFTSSFANLESKKVGSIDGSLKGSSNFFSIISNELIIASSSNSATLFSIPKLLATNFA